MLVNAYHYYLERHWPAAVLLLGLLGMMCLFTAIFYEPLVANFPQANALGFGLEGLTLLVLSVARAENGRMRRELEGLA